MVCLPPTPTFPCLSLFYFLSLGSGRHSEKADQVSQEEDLGDPNQQMTLILGFLKPPEEQKMIYGLLFWVPHAD